MLCRPGASVPSSPCSHSGTNLPADSFMVLLCGLLVTKVLVLKALLKHLTCKALGWPGAGGAGGSFSPRKGPQDGSSQASHRWHYISCNIHQLKFSFTSSVSAHFIWSLQANISFDLQIHAFGSCPPAAAGLPCFEAGIRQMRHTHTLTGIHSLIRVRTAHSEECTLLSPH